MMKKKILSIVDIAYFIYASSQPFCCQLLNFSHILSTNILFHIIFRYNTLQLQFLSSDHLIFNRQFSLAMKSLLATAEYVVAIGER